MYAIKVDNEIAGAWVKVADAAGLKAEMRNMNLKAGN